MGLSDEDSYALKVANKTAEGTQDENGKTIANSKAQAVADAYKKLGLLNDVLKYIKDNDIAPSEMGLSKSVYNKLIGQTAFQEAYSKTLFKSKSSKKSEHSSTKKGVSVSGPMSSKNLKISQIGNVRPSLNSNFVRAYSNTLSQGSQSSRTGRSTTCPKCGNRVPAGTNVCPVCGTRLN